MDDPLPVGEGEPLGHRGHDGGRQAGITGEFARPVQPGAQRLADQVLHGDEGRVAEDVAVVHLHNRRVAEPRQGARLRQQAADHAWLGGHLRMQDLHRAGASEVAVARLEHLRHRTPAERSEELIRPDLATSGRR